jgi:hypothetical protein
VDKTEWGTRDDIEHLSRQFNLLLTSSPIMDISTNELPYFTMQIGKMLVASSVTFSSGGVAYLLEQPKSNDGFVLLLTSALDVIQIYQRRWDSLGMREIASNLSARCIPFTPAIQGPPMSLSEADPVKPFGLRYRPHGYIPSEADVAAYHREVRSFLIGGRGQLTLYHGGLISRIAMDYISLDHDALMPELSQTTSSLSFQGRHFWFNSLTDQELHLICGVYHVNTGLLFLEIIDVVI